MRDRRRTDRGTEELAKGRELIKGRGTDKETEELTKEQINVGTEELTKEQVN
jgi:hypothetical protein